MKYQKILDKLLTKYDKKQLLSEFEDYLENKYHDELKVPLSIFTQDLTALESIVKFLVDEKKVSYSEIGNLLQKDRRVIWITYKRGSAKHPERLDLSSKTIIPINRLVSTSLSLTELIVLYLKDSCSLKNSEIAKLLKKDDRTIWTVYSRAKKKGGQR